MMTLLLKEIRSFLNSVTGYLVICVFLTLNSVFLWLMPGDFNLIDSGYAGLEGLFAISPWVFMFLIPAITMRLFADERRAGTMEFLFTKPLTDLQIIGAKYLAGLLLVVFSLIPTLLYYFTIYTLGDPVGNIDTGAVMGSYIGLFFLGGAYVAIGLFASSLTDNAIISFITAALLCFIFFLGFDQIAALDIFGGADLLIYSLGINEHYMSISRGVVDSRDLLYFIGLIVAFGAVTRLALQRRNWDGSRMRADLIQFGLILAAVVMINIAGQISFFRLDLTAEKRYSLSDATVDLIRTVDDPLLFKVYLEGDFPADFQRLRRETRQMLDEFRAYNGNIEYTFINPNASSNRKEREEIGEQLEFKGLAPVTLDVNTESGRSQQKVFPGAIASLRDREAPVNLLQSQLGQSPQAQINSSVQNLEYALANALRQLVSIDKPLVAFLEGHGELDTRYVADFAAELSRTYLISRFNIREFEADSVTGEVSLTHQQRRLNRLDMVIIAKPTQPFNELDRFLLDQFIMSGGKVMWLIDAVDASMDSLTQASEFLAIPSYDRLNIDDMLFRYGVRINTNLLQDIVSAGVNDRREVRPWTYFPVIMPRIDHPITKGLNAIRLQFANTIDTVRADNVSKQYLLVSSENSRAQSTPGIVSLRTLYSEQHPSAYTQSHLPVGILLEGHFESIFRNRITPKSNSGEQVTVRDSGRFSQQIVIADGDIIANQLSVVNPNIPRGTPLPLGYDQYTGIQFGNRDFLLNAVDYMLDESGLISVRSRELKLRLLDRTKQLEKRNFWVVLNTAAPVVFVVLLGLLFNWNRKRKYAVKAKG